MSILGKAKYFIDHVTNKIKIGIEFLTLKDNNCDFLKNIYYDDIFDTTPTYKENYQIIEPQNLKGLNNIEFKYEIYEK